MKTIAKLCLAALTAMLALCSCGAPTFRTSALGTDGRPVSSNLLTLPGLGQDITGVVARFPDGSGVQIESINQSRGLGQFTDLARSISLDRNVLGPGVKGWFGQKTTEATQAGLTSRAKIGADAAVETQRLKLLEPVAPVP